MVSPRCHVAGCGAADSALGPQERLPHRQLRPRHVDRGHPIAYPKICLAALNWRSCSEGAIPRLLFPLGPGRENAVSPYGIAQIPKIALEHREFFVNDNILSRGALGACYQSEAVRFPQEPGDSRCRRRSITALARTMTLSDHMARSVSV